jgi:hypothetical protein
MAPDFRKIRDGDDLATFLPCEPQLVADRIAGDTSAFVRHMIPKRNVVRGYREVWECESPTILQALKSLHERFDEFARAYVDGFPHDAAHGYVRGRSIKTNALVHVKTRRLLHADIKNFFPSITVDRLEAFFESVGMQKGGARALARFATVEGRLALGFPSSPVIANAVCVAMDRDLTALAQKYTSAYSRYADDLAFSSRDMLPWAAEVEEVVNAHGFELAHEKTSVHKRGQAYFVTGLSVSEPDRPRAPRTLKRRLRQELHYIETYGLYEHLGARGYGTYRSGINYLGGALRFLHAIEPELAKPLRARWRAALDKAGAAESYESRSKAGRPTVSLFFDESVVDVAKRRIMLLGGIAIEEVDIVRAQVSRLLGDKRVDPFGSGDQSKLEDKGLHWADLHPDVRTEVVALLARVPLQAYIAYATLPDDGAYAQTYKRLITAMMKRRLVALDARDVALVFEENSNIKKRDLEDALATAHRETSTMGSDSKGPRSITLKVCGKLEEPCLALADGVLAVFGEYMKSPPSKDPSVPTQFERRFQRLRTKIRIVQSLDDDQLYSRRKLAPRW